LTNCCPQVNTVNTNDSGSSSDFVDFVDQNDPPTGETFVTQLNNQNVDQISIEVVNTVNNSSETPTESGVDLDQQLVNKGQHGQQTGSADNAIAPMPIEVDATSIDEPEEAIAQKTIEVATQTIKAGDYVHPLPDTTAHRQLIGVLKREIWEVSEVARPTHSLMVFVRPVGSSESGGWTFPADQFELVSPPEPKTSEAQIQLSQEVEQLTQALPFAESLEDFVAIIEDSPRQAIEDAIALQTDQPRRQQLTEWLNLPAGELEPRQDWQQTVEVYGQLLVEAFDYGLEAFKSLLQPWSFEERWGALLHFGEVAPRRMQQLAAIEPDWFRLCDV